MKRLVGIIVIGIFAVTTVAVYLAELHSSRNDAAVFGGATFVSFLIFWQLGWTMLPPLRRRR
jgi:hypothetical protein